MSSSKSKPGGSSHKVMDDKTCRKDSSNQEPPRGKKWWLHRKEHQDDCMNQKVDVLDTELEVFSTSSFSQYVKLNEEDQFIGEYYDQVYSETDGSLQLGQRWEGYGTCVRNEQHCGIWEHKSACCNNLSRTTRKCSMEEALYADGKLMSFESSNCFIPERSKILCSELDSHWVGVEKMQPWWHAADKEALASLVSCKSFGQIENFFHPDFCSDHLQKGLNACRRCSEQEKDQMTKTKVSYLADCRPGNLASLSVREIGCSRHASDELHGSEQEVSCNDHLYPAKLGLAGNQQGSNHDPSKSQLLEALCHSQTRAREAEKLAQKAYDEKEHVIQLFFRQASHLFAYRQWLQILQLEALCIQLRNKDKGLNNCYPILLTKDRQSKNGQREHAKKQLLTPICNISKCTLAFAVGLSLAGVGFLLGWTLGRLLPTF